VLWSLCLVAFVLFWLTPGRWRRLRSTGLIIQGVVSGLVVVYLAYGLFMYFLSYAAFG